MRQNEESHIMDNVIYNDLIQRGCSVDVGIVESFTKDSEGKTQDFLSKCTLLEHSLRLNTILNFIFNKI